MSNRREFLQGCVAVTGTLASSSVFAKVARQGNFLPERAIFDDGFAEARAFADAARALGMTTHAISGDVTSLWYDDLYFQWQRGSAVIAGLTGASALFCLEKLAWDAGHRVILRVDHTPTLDGGVRHSFLGPTEMSEASLSAGRKQPHSWPARMAQLTTQCPISSAGRTQRSVAEVSGAGDRWCESLVSWVIAPRAA